MWPVGWEALEQWGDDVVRIEPLTGGVGVNEVWSVRVNGHLAVGRLGQRSDADLAWETDLLRHLDREGMPVPAPIPTEVYELAKQWALTAHQALGCSGLTRADLRWDDSRPGTSGLVILELNTQPGMTPLSLAPEQAKWAGISWPELMTWMVDHARHPT